MFPAPSDVESGIMQNKVSDLSWRAEEEKRKREAMNGRACRYASRGISVSVGVTRGHREDTRCSRE